MKHLAIIGSRGIPASHGGFETFAEQLSLYLTRSDWQVTVYCQEEGRGPIKEDFWNGVHRVTIPVRAGGAFGTIIFDLLSILDVIRRRYRLTLTLGYNTAVFAVLLRLFGIRNVINMDGLEWKRAKWNWYQRAWLWLNESAGCYLGNHLIADHPEIAKRLETRVRPEKISTIVYGAFAIENVGDIPLASLGLLADRYVMVVARPEPENSVLEIVQAFSERKRGMNLVVLGNYDSTGNAYHQAVRDIASEEVIFPGAIYDRGVLNTLRSKAYFYIHGHQVGGTNPSLVEAMGASCAVLAHDNRFNRWVAAEAAVYFRSMRECDELMTSMMLQPQLVKDLRLNSRSRFIDEFKWERILEAYENLLVSL